MKAEMFAYDLLSAGYHELHRIFSPDGKEFIYTVFTPAGGLLVEPKGVFGKAFIMYSRMENGQWTEPEEFLYNRGYTIWYPSFSPDGKKLVFGSHGYTDIPSEEPSSCIWYIEREDDGWSKAREIDFGEDYKGRGSVHPSIASMVNG